MATYHILKTRDWGKKLFLKTTNEVVIAKSFIAELSLSHAQSAWGLRGEIVRITRLTACCNYI